MNTHKSILRRILLVLFSLWLAFGAQSVQAAQGSSEDVISYESLKGKTVGMQTGTILDKLLPDHIEDVEIVYYDEIPDLHTALISGKVDAITADEPTLRYMAATDPEVVYNKEVYEPMEYAFILNLEDGQALKAELDAFIKTCKEDGTLDEMATDWFDNANGEREMPDYKSLPDVNGTIRFATDAQIIPFAFVRDGRYAGFEVELITRFCEASGYALEISTMQFGALIPAVNSGKFDVGASCITITDERKQAVLFSEPTYEGGGTIAVKADGQAAGGARPKASDYAKKRIAVLTGSNFPEIISANFPEAEQIFYNTVADMIAALQSGKVEAIALDEPVARSVVAEHGGAVIAEGYLDQFDFAFFTAKGDEQEKLCDELSEFIRELKADGRLDALQKKWFDSVPEESLMSLNPNELPATKGTLKVATLQYPPFSMQGEEMNFGYEAEILALFGEEKGYRVEFTDMNADAVIPAVQSGKFDIAAGATAVTEERKEQVYFSEPEYSGGVVLLVNEAKQSGAGSFFSRIKESFHKTFIRENRYRLFLAGIVMTLLIAVCSTLLGTLLGFLIFLACRRGNRVANAIAGAFSWLMSGMPMVVLLMILYYIVFGSVAISGAAVAIIGFTLVFGAEVFGMMKTAVGAVDAGQMEAAFALGYTDRRAFFRHILPQAMPHFLPAYRGGLVSLIKSTSIVGYVAVQDLTKMGDIVRSRTYEAFFPLIAVAVIYFVLAAILVFAVDRITLRIDPLRRKKGEILKGIDTHD